MTTGRRLGARDHGRRVWAVRPSSHRPTGEVAVVGAGISGLIAARALSRAGADVSVYEASERVGGQIRTEQFCGQAVDLGAEALHLASPAVRQLVAELGLDEPAIASNPGKTWLRIRDRLVTMPAGVGPAGPTRLGPVISSRALSLRGLARAALEPWKARAKVTDDISVAEFITHRFGSEVSRTFVDPMLGGLHSGDISRLSLQSASPMLAGAARAGKPLTTSRKLRRAAPATPASFLTWPDGLGRLVDRIREDITGELHTSSPVDRISCEGDGFTVTSLGQDYRYDAVIITTPAASAANIVGAIPEASGALKAMRTATVASLLVGFERADVDDVPALKGTGILLGSDSGMLLKSATFLSSKWPHLDRPDTYVMRLSAGRVGQSTVSELPDDELIARLLADLRELTGLSATPVVTRLHRWDDTMPQLEIGHADRLRTVRDSLWPGVYVAGAAYDGVGLASAIASGQRAADDALEHLEREPA